MHIFSPMKQHHVGQNLHFAHTLTLFEARVGQFVPRYHIFVIISTEVGLGSPKLVTLFLFLFDLSQKSHFWNFFFKIFKKSNIKILGGPRLCRENWKNFEKNLFLQIFSFFSCWILIVHVLSFLLRYITLL